MFDSHCHLQDLRFEGDVTVIMERSRQEGISQMLCCGTKPSDWSAVEQFASKYSEIIPAFGIHPWYVDEVGGEWKDLLRRYLGSNPNAAVGEIGLDFVVSPRRDDLQVEIFLDQMRVAKEFSRPVSVHCVRAWGRLLEVLEHIGEEMHGMVIHSFSGSPEIARQLLKFGVYFSFSAAITKPDYKRAADLVQAVPLDHLLIETDAPDMVPYSLKDRVYLNEPANLRYVAQKIAKFRGMSVEMLAAIATENAQRVFCE